MVEVAYAQSQQDVLTKVQEYWLKNHSRVHDVIVVKIDQVPEGETPRHMQVSYIPKLQAYIIFSVILNNLTYYRRGISAFRTELEEIHPLMHTLM